MTKISINAAEQQLHELIAWIDQHFKGIELPADRRSRMAAGCFDVALEHQAAIAVLCSGGLFGSLFSLVRVLFEAYVRGEWLLRCATDVELDLFEKDDLKKSFSELILAVETKLGIEKGPLFNATKKSWSALNSFTHTGYRQVLRRNSDTRTGPNYRSGEVVKVLRFSGVIGLLSALELSDMAGNSVFSERVLENAKEFMVKCTATVQEGQEN